MSAEMDRALADAVRAGEILRQGREQAGMHVAALAVALKVPVHKLESLESGHLEVFPDAVFVRALASSVCRTLKIDPTQVLALLPQNPTPRLSSHDGINASFKPGATKLASSSSTSGSRKVVATVLVLLVAAVALIFVPRDWLERLSNPSSNTVISEPVPERSQASISTDVAGTAAVAASEPASALPLEAISSARSVPSIAPALAAAASIASPAAVAGSEAVAVDHNPLVIRARGESWVQVRSSTSGTVFQRVLTNGETVTVPGTPPWTVVIGKADATEVSVRGKPMDLKAIARENVARFEVK
ncbi:helix-turn-helix domain-containing protein [Paracidovorax konjaci]|nr:helix-turn-helix domain-containing protein [Paracidovorax konjaci]